MPRLEELPADQKAVLQLLLKQGKTYDEIAALLRLDRHAVRERALDALDAIGPQTLTGLDGDDQDEIADHLLLQQSASERAATRELLESSAPGRAWARVVAAELRPLAGDALPEIPAEGAEVEQAFDALAQRQTAEERQERSSRLGGAFILAAIAIVVVLGIVLLVKGRGDDDDNDSPEITQAPTGGTGSEGGTTGGGATGGTGTTAVPANFQDQTLQLNAPGGGKSPGGVVKLQGPGIAFEATGLSADNKYLVWLYNSDKDAIPLGFADYNTKTKTIAGGTQVPQQAEAYKYLVITREATTDVSKLDTVPDNKVLKSQPFK